MCLTGIEIWYECVRISQLHCVATKWILKTERLRQSQLSSTRKKNLQYYDISAQSNYSFEKPFPGLLENWLETLTWSLSPCLLLPHQRWSWTQPWQHSMSRFRGCSDNFSPGWRWWPVRKWSWGPASEGWFHKQLSCDVSAAACLPLYYIAKQNTCFIFGCWRRWMGFGVNVAV